MRVTAARLVQHGQPLQIEEVDIAEPGDQEALLEVAYAGVNPVDMYAAQGRVAPDAPVPRTLGGEAAGTVDGRPVMVRGYGLGTTRDGLWASAAVVPRGALIDVPAGVDLSAAATMGVAGVTAWRTVAEVAAVNADDTVLVLGARGGVGSMIVSLAHSLGATVAGQTGHEDNHDWITAHGADYVVVSDAAGLDEALADLRPAGPVRRVRRARGPGAAAHALPQGHLAAELRGPAGHRRGTRRRDPRVAAGPRGRHDEGDDRLGHAAQAGQ